MGLRSNHIFHQTIFDGTIAHITALVKCFCLYKSEENPLNCDYFVQCIKSIYSTYVTEIGQIKFGAIKILCYCS